MDSVYEDVRHILENRRIRSEIVSREMNDRLREEHPSIAAIEEEIDQLEMERMLMAIRGESSEELLKNIEKKRESRKQILSKCGVDLKAFEPKPFLVIR